MLYRFDIALVDQPWPIDTLRWNFDNGFELLAIELFIKADPLYGMPSPTSTDTSDSGCNQRDNINFMKNIIQSD